MTPNEAPTDVEAWNDRLATEHDIDAYYADANPLIRAIERRRLRIIRQMIGSAKGSRVLEVGCGGDVLQLFPEAERVGVDPSGAMLEKAARKLADESVVLIQGELRTAELPSASFDVVICTEVLEHVVDPAEVIADIREVVKPGGLVVITIPNDGLIEALKKVVRLSGLGFLPGLRRHAWGGDEFHLHAWNLGQMRTLLDSQFKIRHEAFAPGRPLPVRCCFACEPREPGSASSA
ncbi:MAG: methyltransferase domain-containing protein [Acidobacteria bacterium]|nr:methyltransferase domain-containing protein [Acidobacteriota bacterium]